MLAEVSPHVDWWSLLSQVGETQNLSTPFKCCSFRFPSRAGPEPDQGRPRTRKTSKQGNNDIDNVYECVALVKNT